MLDIGAEARRRWAPPSYRLPSSAEAYAGFATGLLELRRPLGAISDAMQNTTRAYDSRSFYYFHDCRRGEGHFARFATIILRGRALFVGGVAGRRLPGMLSLGCILSAHCRLF